MFNKSRVLIFIGMECSEMFRAGYYYIASNEIKTETKCCGRGLPPALPCACGPVRPGIASRALPRGRRARRPWRRGKPAPQQRPRASSASAGGRPGVRCTEPSARHPAWTPLISKEKEMGGTVLCYFNI